MENVPATVRKTFGCLGTMLVPIVCNYQIHFDLHISTRLLKKTIIFLFFALFSCIMKEIGFVHSLSIQYVETVAEEPNFPNFYEDLQVIMMNCVDDTRIAMVNISQ